LWNVLALYLFVFRWPSMVNAAIVIVAAIFMFAPIVFVHPMRVERMRWPTLVATGLWALCAALAVWQDLAPGFWVKAGLVATALYFFGLPLQRHSFWAEE
jgi:phosphatidylcholine synthase